MPELTLALDIGGTKIAAALVDPDGVLVHREQLPTPHADREQVWGTVDALIESALVVAGGRPLRGVGAGCAGPIDTVAGTVSPLNIAAWQQFPLVDRLAGRTGLPVRLAGDVVCLAMGEHWRGAGRGSQFLLGMVVSTGIGGGLVQGGVPYLGRTGNAGHVGHVVVEPDGPRCACGAQGCVEAVASGPHLARWAHEHGWDAPPDADAKALAEAARRGDPVAVQAFTRGAEAIAVAIASAAAVCDLDLVIVGGGVANAGEVLFGPLRAALPRYAGLSFLRGLRVVPAELGGDAGLVGAAALWRS
ncbi:ROK family protein [Mycolicibacterium aubagnense]|uniref:Glucokinase n=1 Tax=Mycolicibacterium aubagnense TaxID=319707 RepID=A0ABM7ICN8_9MYCO|nr:ROK family protein [Mycolicibacterium aubagnense]TLH57052.1 sugar kinase [Mycolicibacterium aubagnense]WGI33847.1 ROK family protein [Mycolicibacterium aubagnense]BBX84380.1 glucokinase [Mycolicibacterium aubagnense]